MLWYPEAGYKTDKRIISEVKTGDFTINDGMKQIAADMGNFTLPNNNTPYPKLQFWQITDEYFENPSFLRDNIKLPYNWIIPRKKAERHFDNQQLQLL